MKHESLLKIYLYKADILLPKNNVILDHKSKITNNFFTYPNANGN